MPLTPKQQPPYYETENRTKTYIAILNQIGTDAPTATILINTIGNIIWTRQSEGFYIGTLENTFPIAKTTVLIANTSSQLCSAASNEDGEPSDEIYIDTGIDGALYLSTIIIQIYP